MTNPALPSARIALLAVGMLLLSGALARADDMGLQAVLGETGSYESNPLMLLHNVAPLYGSTTSPELIFNDSTPVMKFSSDTLVNENIFDRTNFDSTDAHEAINLAGQASPRWSYGLQGKANYDTTRTSELGTFGQNQATASVRHLGFLGAPEITYTPTEIDKFTLSGSVDTSSYDSSTFIDYDVFAINPTYTRSLNPLNAGVLGVDAERYRTTSGPQIVIDSISPSIGWIGSLSPRLTAKANAGPQVTDQYGSSAASKSWNLSYQFMADLTYKGIQDTTELNATRHQYPFGNGTEALATTFAVTESHIINPNFALNIGANYQTDDYQTSTFLALATLAAANTALVYHATERIDLTAGYQYRRETFTGASGSAEDNMVTFGLNWRPQGWSL